MLLNELFGKISEGVVADDWEKLKDAAEKYAPYMFIDARPVSNEDIGTSLPSIDDGMSPGSPKRIMKDDYIVMILTTGITPSVKPIKQQYVMAKSTFDAFTPLPNRKADIEGFLPYEAVGDSFDAVENGSDFIMKRGKNLTQVPAALFNKQFRKSAK